MHALFICFNVWIHVEVEHTITEELKHLVLLKRGRKLVFHQIGDDPSVFTL